MTVTLEASRDVRLSAEAFWRIVDDARYELRLEHMAVPSVQQKVCRYFPIGIQAGDWQDAPITATVTRE